MKRELEVEYNFNESMNEREADTEKRSPFLWQKEKIKEKESIKKL